MIKPFSHILYNSVRKSALDGHYLIKPVFTFLVAFSLVFTCSLSRLNAQSLNINFTNFSNDPALYRNPVYDIKQDRWGYLWLGTYSGLYRYDGYSFIPYNNIRKGISITSITRLLITENDELWVGTKTNGLFVINLLNFSIEKKFPKEGLKNILDINQDKDGNLWISNENTGLYKYHNITKHLTHYEKKKNNCPENNISKILCDKNGTILFAVINDDIFQYNLNGDNFSKKIILNDFSPFIRDIELDKDGKLLINSYSYLVKVDLSSNRVQKIYGEYPVYKSSIQSGGPIFIDEKDNIWFGTSNNGLFIYNQSNKELINYVNDPEINGSISSNSINCIYKDNCNNIWIGTLSGLSKLNYVQQHISSYLYKKDNSHFLSSADVRSVYLDSLENTWVGTINGGLNLINKNGEITKYYFNAHNKKYTNNSINTIYASHNGKLLLGSKKGLIVFNTKSKKFEESFSKELNKNIYTFGVDIYGIFEENDSILWLGAKKIGLVKLNKKNHNYTIQKDLINSSNKNLNLDVWTFHKSKKNLLYIGTSDGLKIMIYNRDKLELKSVPIDSISNINIFSIFENSNGHLWLATSDNGLYDYNPKNGLTRHFTTDNGLLTNMICSITVDDDQNLWLSSVAGIMVLDPISGNIIKTLDIADGLPENRFNFNSSYKSHEGRIFFGGFSGLFSFIPKELHTPKNNASVIITSFKTNYDEKITQIKTDTSIDLLYNENNFSFDFAYLDFSNPTKNQFSYKLVGFKDNWENIGNKHSAAFTNLNPGQYTLLIRASNRDTLWSTNILKIYINITPPYWKTLWFNILVVISSLGFIFYLFYLIFKRRDAKRKLTKSELSALRAQLNPHFIFNCMTSLQHFILSKENNLALPYLNKFARLVRMILENSEKESISIEQEIEFINLYTFMESSRLDHKVEIEINLNENIKPHSTMIPPMLLQPIIENAFVHGLIGKTPGGKLIISFTKADGVVACSIRDNGIGREKAKSNKDKTISKDKSFGLKITNERLHLLGISYAKNIGLDIIDLKDNNGIAVGTEVIVTIPIFEYRTN